MSSSRTLRPVAPWTDAPSPPPLLAAHEPDRPRAALRQLVGLRAAAIAAQVVCVAVTVRILGAELPVAGIGAALTALALFNVWTSRRLRDARPVTDAQLLAQLSVDMLALTVVLAMSGGASNPFGGIVLLPLALGATCLTWRSAWTLGVGSMASYSVLLWLSQPLVMHADELPHAVVLSAGMWISFCLTSIVVVGVVLRITYALRRDEQLLEEARRKAAFDEHIERIGALAAGAAHELSSPLASIAVIVDDLQREAHSPQVKASLELLSRLLASCRDSLCGLLSYGNSTFCSPPERVQADAFMRTCIDSFAVRRQDCVLAFRVETAGDPPFILANRALRQALTSILDNAADVSPQDVEVRIGWTADSLRIRVRDRGPGICAEVIGALGKLVFLSTKPCGKGNGLGLYLANTAVARFGGTLSLANADDRGAVAEIVLPVCEPAGR